MANFPRIKWLNVDGQQVPFTEPQHFTGNGDETVRTGHDNPLPVANYTKKGNIWLPVSEENPMPTQLTGSIVEETVLERFVFDGKRGLLTSYFLPPADAKGAIVALNVHGATGSYINENDGLHVRLYSYALGSSSVENAFQVGERVITKRDDITILYYIYPGIELKDAVPRDNSRLKFYISHMYVPKQLALFLEVFGEVTDGEGYDISAHVKWLK